MRFQNSYNRENVIIKLERVYNYGDESEGKIMIIRKLNIEISESLFKELEYLSEIKEESINDLVIEMIARNILSAKRNAETLKEKLDNISQNNLNLL